MADDKTKTPSAAELVGRAMAAKLGTSPEELAKSVFVNAEGKAVLIPGGDVAAAVSLDAALKSDDTKSDDTKSDEGKGDTKPADTKPDTAKNDTKGGEGDKPAPAETPPAADWSAALARLATPGTPPAAKPMSDMSDKEFMAAYNDEIGAL